MDAIVYVTGQGLAKVKGQQGSTLSLWHTRQLRPFKAPQASTRPLVSKAQAQAVLQALQEPLPAAQQGPPSGEAVALLASSNELTAFAAMLRRLYAKHPPEDSDLEPKLALEQALVDELALALGVDKGALPAFTTGPKAKKPARDRAWLDALCDAGLGKGGALDFEARCVALPKDRSPFSVWRAAYDALRPLGMYPVIADERLDGLRRPDDSIAGEPYAEPKVKWPTVDPRPLDQAVLAVVPARQPWLAAPYLRFGGFNACPKPAEHAKQHERWLRAYGALPVVIDFASVDLVLTKPPRGKAGAAAAAKQMLAYCDELQVVPAARRLQDAEKSLWSFWWD